MEREVGLRLSLRDRAKVARELADTEKAAGGVADATEEIGPAGDKAARGLAKASDGKFARGFRAILSGAKGVAGFVGRGMVAGTKAGVVGLTGMSIALTGVSVKSIALASDASETASAFNTVFGPSAKRVGGQLDDLTRRFGLYNPELQDAARQFGVFAKAAGIPRKNLTGFSTDLVKAGLDLGSFYNADPGDVFQALQSGLSGEAEPLRRFGIFISDASMKAEAATMGLSDELTEQQKVMVRQRIIMKSLGDAQGDLARTSKGLANQQRGAEGRVKTFFTLLGGPLSTAATGAFRGFNKVAKVGIRELKTALPGLEVEAAKLSKRFVVWGRELAQNLPGAIDTVGQKWDNLKTRFSGGGGFDGVGSQLGDLASNVKDLGPAFSALGDELPGVRDTLAVTGTVTGFLADHVDTLSRLMPFLVAGYIAIKVAQLAANIVLAASLPLKVAELMTNRQLTKSNMALVASRGAVVTSTAAETVAVGANTAAQNTGILARARGVAALVLQKTAQTAVTVATKAYTAAQWLLNVAMTANPIGLAVAAGVALAAGLYLLYRRSETFRNAVGWLWNNALKPLGTFIKNIFLAYLRTMGKLWLSVGIAGVKAFRVLVGAAFKAFGAILGAAESGMGWIPGIGGKIKKAKKTFEEFSDKVTDKLLGVEAGLKRARDKFDALGRKKVTPTIEVQVRTRSDGVTPVNKFAGDMADVLREKGGPVRAGQPYIVGERRPELFVPETDGQILPDLNRVRAPGVVQPSMPAAWGAGDIDAAMLADEASQLSVGPAWPGGPIVVQLVVDKKVLAEAVLDGIDDKAARR